MTAEGTVGAPTCSCPTPVSDIENGVTQPQKTKCNQLRMSAVRPDKAELHKVNFFLGFFWDKKKSKIVLPVENDEFKWCSKLISLL
jgi:hypothetical protein